MKTWKFPKPKPLSKKTLNDLGCFESDSDPKDWYFISLDLSYDVHFETRPTRNEFLMKIARAEQEKFQIDFKRFLGVK